MSKTTKQSIDAKIWKILHSETLLSDLTFRFACESFPDFPAYIASAITGETVIPKDVRLQHRIMNPGGRDIITDVIVYGEDMSMSIPIADSLTDDFLIYITTDGDKVIGINATPANDNLSSDPGYGASEPY